MKESSRLSRIVREMPPSGIREFFDLAANTPGVISLGVGEPDFVTPWTICESAIYSLEKGRTSYTSNHGLLELRQEISRYLVEQWKIPVYDPATEIMVTVGVSEAVDIALRAILDPGDEVILSDPCYVSYSPLVTLAGGVPILVQTFPEDGFQISAQAIREAITPRTKMVFLNFPNNPTGAALSPERVSEIASVILEKNLILLTDEIYGELTYDREHASLAAFPEIKKNTILLHGFSKAFAMTGWRLGFLAAPEELLIGALKIHQYSALCAPVLAQAAAIDALRNGLADMRKMREHYDRRRRYITERLNEMGLPCHLPQGAFYVFPSIRHTGMNAKEFARKLLQAESVAVVPGDAFGAAGQGHIRCSYATSLDNLREAMDRMQKFLGRL